MLDVKEIFTEDEVAEINRIMSDLVLYVASLSNSDDVVLRQEILNDTIRLIKLLGKGIDYDRAFVVAVSMNARVICDLFGEDDNSDETVVNTSNPYQEIHDIIETLSTNDPDLVDKAKRIRALAYTIVKLNLAPPKG